MNYSNYYMNKLAAYYSHLNRYNATQVSTVDNHIRCYEDFPSLEDMVGSPPSEAQIQTIY